jgi:hypothetical protein
MLADGGNLLLQVTGKPDGKFSRSWIFRYERDGKRHDDLEKFFDRVNHDVLMGLIAKRVGDKRLRGGSARAGNDLAAHQGCPGGCQSAEPCWAIPI